MVDEIFRRAPELRGQINKIPKASSSDSYFEFADKCVYDSFFALSQSYPRHSNYSFIEVLDVVTYYPGFSGIIFNFKKKKKN